MVLVSRDLRAVLSIESPRIALPVYKELKVVKLSSFSDVHQAPFFGSRSERSGRSVSLPKDRDNASRIISKLQLAQFKQLGDVEAFLKSRTRVFLTTCRSSVPATFFSMGSDIFEQLWRGDGFGQDSLALVGVRRVTRGRGRRFLTCDPQLLLWSLCPL